jgi:hypothetical protein
MMMPFAWMSADHWLEINICCSLSLSTLSICFVFVS